jgi:hypothetical protein
MIAPVASSRSAATAIANNNRHEIGNDVRKWRLSYDAKQLPTAAT